MRARKEAKRAQESNECETERATDPTVDIIADSHQNRWPVGSNASRPYTRCKELLGCQRAGWARGHCHHRHKSSPPGGYRGNSHKSLGLDSLHTPGLQVGQEHSQETHAIYTGRVTTTLA